MSSTYSKTVQIERECACLCMRTYECVCVCIGESVREWIGGRASRSMHIIKLWTAVQNIRNGFLVILYFHRCCCIDVFVLYSLHVRYPNAFALADLLFDVYIHMRGALCCASTIKSQCENARMMNWEFYELLSSNYWCAHVWERKRVRERKTIGRDSQ